MAITPASRIVEGFSLSHAAILNGTTGLEETWGDIYGIRSGSIAVQSQNYDNTGDDFVLSSWFWFNYGEITIDGGYVPFDLIANLTGETVTSSGATGMETYSLPVWTQNSLNQPTRPMMLRVPSKDQNGLVRELDIILYRVQFMPFTFNGPSYKAGLLLNYSGRALVSSVDELGNALAEKTIGRIVSKPAA
jgi:hypothetical protein